MAKSPAAAAAPKDAPMSDDDMDDEGAGAPEGQDGGDADEGEDSDEQVLLTVTKHADGTYCLYKGDEPEGGDEGGEGAEGGAGGENEQTFDSKGALLKGILDLLNEDEQSDRGEGSSEDQFAAGFNENTPKAPSPIAQKY